jgi:hypothetical protein
MNKLISDYEALDRNEFWKMFLKKLTEYSRGRALALQDAPLDKVARLQGELGAINWVMSRPKDMIDEIAKGAQT